MNETSLTQNYILWSKVLDKISKKIDKQTFDTFLKNTKIYSMDNENIIVSCDSILSKAILNDKFAKEIEDLIQIETGNKYIVVFNVESELINSNKPSQEYSSSFFQNSIIQPEFTFDNFVVGPSNSEAQKASLIVASTPGSMFQTLFIYGGSGLGKTHLLNAIGNYIKQATPEKKVLYTSSQDFLNEYLDYVNGDNKKEQLFKFLKQFDVLLIDDIQMLKDKRKTQEFFFNIYEDFRQNRKQVCITSDKLPGELDGIDTRIITRFTSGLSVPVHQPDSATCKEILKKKIQASGISLSQYDDDVLDFMADKFKDSIRSLEGALLRLNFYASFSHAEHIDLPLCCEALGTIIDVKNANKVLTEQQILSTVAKYYDLSVAQITGKIKTANIMLPRHIAIYLIRDMLDMPLKKIGKVFSNRDHSTIMHSVDKIQEMLKTDKQLQEAINDIKSRLQS